MFAIEKGIPVPSVSDLKAQGIPAFLKSLDVGDSFCAPAEKVNSIRCAAAEIGKKSAMRFVTRSMADKSIRVWRVE